MAQLRKADLEAIKSYYDNELALLTLENKEKDDIISMNREKVHA